jgi:hypothetical protein
MVAASATHVRAIHLARHAVVAPTTHCKNGVIALFNAGNGFPGFQYLTEHLMSNNEILLAFWRLSPTPRDLFTISSTNADLEDSKADFIGFSDRWLRSICDLYTTRARDDGNSSHFGYLVIDPISAVWV